MLFNEPSNYFAYAYSAPMDRPEATPLYDTKGKKHEAPLVDIKEISAPVALGVNVKEAVEGLQTQIRAGAGTVEIQFSGTARGTGQAPTPESVDKERRQELKAIAELNKVDIRTHSTLGVMGLSGLGREGFSEEQRWKSIDEIKRAIDFASDVHEGGSIVVHTGEFPRTIYEKYKQFEAFPEEEKEATYHLVDKTTGRVVTSVNEKQEIWVPIYETDEQGNKVPIKDQDGNVIVDPYSNEPYYNVKTDEKGDLLVEKKVFGQFKKDSRFNGDPYLAAKEFFKEQQTAEVQHHLGVAKEYEVHFKEAMDKREKLIKAYHYYKKLEESMPEEERWKIKHVIRDRSTELIPPDVKDPSKYLLEQINENEKRMAYGRETALSSRKNVETIMKRTQDIRTIEEYGKTKSFDSYARLGLYALDESKSKKNPLFLTLENVYPESFGAHPQELLEIIDRSRQKMAELLHKERGYSQQEAEKVAEQHIKGTFDTGHINMWRRHWRNDPKKNKADNDKEFNKWVLEQVETLAKSGKIGNIHISDNFGYYDEHVRPGQGIAPIRQIMEIFKKHGYDKKMMAEGGWLEGLYDVWRIGGARTIDSPLFGLERSTPQMAWGDVYRGYFGRAHSPYFALHAYVPVETMKPWVEAPFE